MLDSASAILTDTILCEHCGSACNGGSLMFDTKHFCCTGCKTVYEIIHQTGLCEYYKMNPRSGISFNGKGQTKRFDFLDREDIALKLIRFKKGSEVHVSFFLPQMHCSSCIWLLENLSKLSVGVIRSEVDFPRHLLHMVIDDSLLSVRQSAELLGSVGYDPHINLSDLETNEKPDHTKKRLLRIGVAGFCFGNIMMLSFPEYLGLHVLDSPDLVRLFRILNLVLAVPVLFFSAGVFFTSAWQGLRVRFLNIDAPIVFAILLTFIVSVYEILSGAGAGYLDSMSGIIFFMLLGRYYQDRTKEVVSFDYDYKSFFPLSASVLEDDKILPKSLSELKKGDRLLIRNQEIIPADCILFFGKARIDYSFVTGESDPVSVGIGQIIYAGGMQSGGELQAEVINTVADGYLTGLWSREVFKEVAKENRASFIHLLSRQFAAFLLFVSLAGGLFWLAFGSPIALKVMVSVLIVACPCTLLLSSVFTNGNILQLLATHKIFLRNPEVLESLTEINHVVFDKTGTLTISGSSLPVWHGKPLTSEQWYCLFFICRQSAHPLSRLISEYAESKFQGKKFDFRCEDFTEIPGMGISAIFGKDFWMCGSSAFLGGCEDSALRTSVFIKINENLLGYFSFENHYREGLKGVLLSMPLDYKYSVISGDYPAEESNLRQLFPNPSQLLFQQSPHQKLDYILSLEQNQEKTLMIGDGLNDAGALKAASVGLAIGTSVNNFTPACDIYVEGGSFHKIPALLVLAKYSRIIVLSSFSLSLAYNIVGLSFALRGQLSPLVAAILMPVSSISILLFSFLYTRWVAHRLGLLS